MLPGPLGQRPSYKSTSRQFMASIASAKSYWYPEAGSSVCRVFVGSEKDTGIRTLIPLNSLSLDTGEAFLFTPHSHASMGFSSFSTVLRLLLSLLLSEEQSRGSSHWQPATRTICRKRLIIIVIVLSSFHSHGQRDVDEVRLLPSSVSVDVELMRTMMTMWSFVVTLPGSSLWS